MRKHYVKHGNFMNGRIKKNKGLPDGSDFEHLIPRIRNAGAYVKVLRFLDFFFFVSYLTTTLAGKLHRSTRRKPASAPLCPPQIPLVQIRDRTRAAAVGSQRLTA
jgi:hypothetical protein